MSPTGVEVFESKGKAPEGTQYLEFSVYREFGATFGASRLRPFQNYTPVVADSAQKRNIHFQVLHPARPVRLRADPVRLKQILLNLLSNAVKFTDAGEVVLNVSTQGELLHFAVRDTGRGFSAEQQAHLYEPFNRLGAER